MESYYITQVWWQSQEGAPVDVVGFGRQQEEQNEAFETLQDLLNMEERDDDHEEEEMTNAGPKRMEIEIKQRTSPVVVRNIAVISVLAPSGNFKNYSINGRQYKTGGSLESFVSQGMSSDTWKITKISRYPGGHSPPSTTHYQDFAIARQDAAWEQVYSWFETMKPAEINVIKTWSCKVNPGNFVDDDEDDMYGYGGHYTQRVPHAYQHTSNYSYKPPVAMLRTANDEVGALLHQDTIELDEARPVAEKEMEIEAFLEKKDEAETEEEPTAEVSAVVDAASGGSSADSADSSVVFCDCNSPSCNTCEDIATAAACLGGYGTTLH
jgi:hypothetical protein